MPPSTRVHWGWGGYTLKNKMVVQPGKLRIDSTFLVQPTGSNPNLFRRRPFLVIVRLKFQHLFKISFPQGPHHRIEQNSAPKPAKVQFTSLYFVKKSRSLDSVHRPLYSAWRNLRNLDGGQA